MWNFKNTANGAGNLWRFFYASAESTVLTPFRLGGHEVFAEKHYRYRYRTKKNQVIPKVNDLVPVPYQCRYLMVAWWIQTVHQMSLNFKSSSSHYFRYRYRGFGEKITGASNMWVPVPKRLKKTLYSIVTSTGNGTVKFFSYHISRLVTLPVSVPVPVPGTGTLTKNEQISDKRVWFTILSQQKD